MKYPNFLQIKGSMLLKRNTTLSELFKVLKLGYLKLTSSKNFFRMYLDISYRKRGSEIHFLPHYINRIYIFLGVQELLVYNVSQFQFLNHDYLTLSLLLTVYVAYFN